MIMDRNLKLGILGSLIKDGLLIPEYEEAEKGDLYYIFAPILILKNKKLLKDDQIEKLNFLKNNFTIEKKVNEISKELKNDFLNAVSDEVFESDDLRMEIVKNWAFDFVIPQEFILRTQEIVLYVYNEAFELAKPFWGGETPEDFEIENLNGVDIFPNLKSITIDQAITNWEEPPFEFCKSLGITLNVKKY